MILLILVSKSLICTAELQNHMLRGQVFLRDATAMVKEVSGNHQLVVSWELAYPACMDSVCVRFPDSNINDHCPESTLVTEATIEDLPCNTYLSVEVKTSASSFSRTSLASRRIYIGGNIMGSGLSYVSISVASC